MQKLGKYEDTGMEPEELRKSWRTGFSAAEITKDMVAWMPLPEPYRAQEN